MWLSREAGRRFRIQPTGQLHPPNSPWNGLSAKKPLMVKFSLVTFFSHLLEPCSPRSCADHLHHLSSAHFLPEHVFLCYFCCSCVLSGSSLLTISVITTAFKPAVFIRLKSVGVPTLAIEALDVINGFISIFYTLISFLL